MSQETAIIPFPYAVPVAKLQEIIIDLSNPEISRSSVVLVRRTESPAIGRGLWFKISIQIPSGDVEGLRKVLDRYEAQQRIVNSAFAPLG